jgi:hypothetical protein
MVSVSRNCGITINVERILKEKLDEQELNLFYRWLQIIDSQKDIDINNVKRKF